MTPYTLEHFKSWQIEYYTEMLEKSKKSGTLAMRLFYLETLKGLRKAKND